jgi:hypothetical protein
MDDAREESVEDVIGFVMLWFVRSGREAREDMIV